MIRISIKATNFSGAYKRSRLATALENRELKCLQKKLWRQKM